MYIETIRLNKNCEACGSTNYGEDDSGFYVCQTCGTISDIRYGAELEFESQNRFMKTKAKIGRKSSNDYDIDIDIDEEKDNIDHYNDNVSDIDTNVYTNNNTRNNSEVNDFSNASSFGRRRSNKNIIQTQKSLKETLLDSQRIFTKIVGLIGSDTSITGCEWKNDPNLIKYAKTIWFNYINNEYDIQTKQETLFGKCRKSHVKYVRSRTHTVEDINSCSPTVIRETTSSNRVTTTTKKPKHLNEQLRIRKIKSDNILKLYNDNKQMVNKKKFIEEYDEVIKFLKSDEVKRLLAEKDITINPNAISYSELLMVCNILKIEYNNNNNSSNNNSIPSFEELIHLIFIDQTMNYQTTQLFNYDSKKSTLNGDYYLSLIYQLFNQFPSSSMSSVILSKDLISLYKKFDYISHMNQSELKMFKYSNYDKFTLLLNAYDHSDKNLLSRASRIIKSINTTLLHMPIQYEFICNNILTKIESQIAKLMGSTYLIEDVCVAVCFYVIKVVYGLNDLPYLTILQKHKEYFINNIDMTKAISQYEANTTNDSIGQFYKALPSLFTIVELLNKEISKETNSQIMTLNQSLKHNLNREYKEEYAKCNYEHLYSNVQNMFSAKNIKELETKFFKCSQNNLNSNNNNEGILNKVVIHKSNRFQIKQLKNKNSKSRKLNSFIKEEINYHEDNIVDEYTSIEYPYPCDTYIHHLRQANKFDSFRVPTTEALFLYFFSKYFKIDYNSLKVLIKVIERLVDNN